MCQKSIGIFYSCHKFLFSCLNFNIVLDYIFKMQYWVLILVEKIFIKTYSIKMLNNGYEQIDEIIKINVLLIVYKLNKYFKYYTNKINKYFKWKVSVCTFWS